jgi:filamentous hemagglutinin family protein
LASGLIYDRNKGKFFKTGAMKGLIPTSLASLTTVGYLLPTLPVCAQIVPDNSLGPDSSIVVPNQTIRGIPSDRIDGGAVRGNNLFHSFEEFNVEAGRGAFFANPDSIANILSRVTGENLSNIFGTLGVLGDANLFLVNPNGIVFGPNARLDVSGSFFATTNNGFIFENGFEFVASNSDAPPLLTINIPIGLRLRENPGVIENQSRVLDSRSGDVAGLQVPFGQTLALVGGEVILNSGALTAPGGRLELAGVSGIGTIQLDTEENNINGLQISLPVNRENIILTNGAFLNVVSSRGGDISIDGRNVEISQFSGLFAGIAPEEGTPDTQAGDIEIIASEDFQLFNFSEINNRVAPDAQGNAGDIRISADNVFLNGIATLSSSSFGRGNAGNIIIEANNRTSFDGGSLVFSTIEPGGEGLGGNIRIITKDLSLSGGTTLQALTRGIGDAGNVDITASGSVSLDGSSFTGFPTAIYSSVESGGEGNGGNINISTGSLSVSNGATLQALVRGSIDGVLPPGEGNAGIVNINATGRVSFDGIGSGAFSTLQLGTTGSGGNVLINAGSVFVTNGASLSSSTGGIGNAGTVRINARNIVSFDGVGEASADGINIIEFPSGAFSTVEAGAIGNSGGVEINTGSLRVTNGAILEALVRSTFLDDGTIIPGQGNAGGIRINATDSVVFSGFNSLGTRSGAISTLGIGAIGRGGSIDINTGNLLVTNGALLDVATFGFGNAGQITINARDTVTFSQGSSAYSSVEVGAFGESGGINITTNNLEVNSKALLDVSTLGVIGNAGQVVINANDTVTLDDTVVSSKVGFLTFGDSGSIEINTGNLFVTNGAQLLSQTEGIGNAGDIIINATDQVLFEGFDSAGFPSLAFSSVKPGAIGDSGTINITARSVEVLDGGTLTASVDTDPSFTIAAGQGNAGSIEINATDNVLFEGGGAFSIIDLGAVGQGGNITIRTANLSVTEGAVLDVGMRAATVGDAGNIIIEATENVLFDESIAFSRVDRFAEGNSGNIEIMAGNLSVLNGGQLQVQMFGNGTAGNVMVNATDSVLFDGASESGGPSGAFSTLEVAATGEAGSIDISANRNVAVTNGAQLQVQTSGIGNAGSINISAGDSVLFSGGATGTNFNPFTSGAFSTVNSSGVGNSGDITITTGSLNVLNGATLETAVDIGIVPGRISNAGEIRIDAAGDVTFDGVGSVDSFQQVGEGEQLIDPEVGQFFRSQGVTSVASGVSGNSGDIIINAENLGVTNGALLEAKNSGSGSSGTIDINARNNVIFGGIGVNESISQASTRIGVFGGGVGGNVEIDAINLSVTDGASLVASIEENAQGDAGNIVINTRDNSFFDGVFLDSDRVAFPSQAASIVGRNTIGTGGDVNITTTNLSVTNGAQLDVRTFGILGIAGNVNVKASETIFFDGVYEPVDGQPLFLDGQQVFRIFSGAFTTAEVFTNNEFTGIGFGGNIDLNAENISLSNFAQLKTAAIGFGLAGNIFVTTGNLLATSGAQIQAQVDGVGAAGNVGITARNNISIDDSSVFTTVDGESFGEGGGIELNTGNLFITNGGQLQAQINDFSIGNAGKVLINASDSVFFDGINLDGLSSQAFTSIGEDAEGIGGDITINTQNLSVTNGASLSASLFNVGSGEAGTITINAAERVYFDGGSGADSGTGIDAIGSGGQIIINTRNISFTNGVELFTGTLGRGEPDNPTVAGNIIIQAQEDVYFDDSRAFSTVEEGAVNAQGGTIYVSAENLLVTNGGQLQALTRGQGNAGFVIIETSNSVRFEGFNIAGFSSAALSSVEQSATGIGGDVVIRTDRLSILDGALLSAENVVSNPENKAGNIWVDANTINLENNANILTRTASGDGGDIGISARDLIMRNGSQIRTDAGIGGDGGNITINAELLVGLRRSHITANAFDGRGGTININADGRFGFEFYSRERLEKLFGTENLSEFDPTLLPNSSITSISLTDPSLSGTVEINEFDPTIGLIELPRNVVDPNDLINQDPCKQGQESELYIRGRGGIQVTPDDKLDGGEIEVDLVEPTPSRQQNRRNSSPDQSRTKTEENQPISSLDIVPARGWIRDENGDVILVDYDPTQTGVQRPQHRQQNPNVCQPVSENPRSPLMSQGGSLVTESQSREELRQTN